MRRLVPYAVLCLIVAAIARADDFNGRASVSYQSYDLGRVVESGIRQSYDLGFDRAFTGTSRLRFFFRAEDFAGQTEVPMTTFIRDSRSREYQPSGEFLWRADTLRLLLRGDYVKYEGETERFGSSRTTERGLARFDWSPAGLPAIAVLAQRNATREGESDIGPLDEVLTASLTYPWRGLAIGVDARHIHSEDETRGYARTNETLGASMSYSWALPSDRLSVTANAGAHHSSIEERATGDQASNVPIQVPLSRALFAVDDTPVDGRDHPLSPYPSLKDGDRDTSTNLSLGPDGASFYNLAVDYGRVDRLDEIRVIVRDRAGNPIRGTGGPITWDAYVSEDGLLWRLVSGSEATFDSSRSAYSITFPALNTRWAKVVSFGVQSEPALITELEAYYHVGVSGSEARTGDQQSYNAGLAVSVRPTRAVTVTYGGTYSGNRTEDSILADRENTNIDHVLTADYRFAQHWTARGQGSLRRSEFLAREPDTATMVLFALDYQPTRRLQLTAEYNRQDQKLEYRPTQLESATLRVIGQPLRSMSFNFDLGVQKENVDGGEQATRTFLSLTSNARLTRTARLLLTGSVQRSRVTEDTPIAVLGGFGRDQRFSAEMQWQPGRPLLVTARLGYVSSAVLSGFTQRVRMEWSPFDGGTISLAASYDEDIDPSADRRARRLVFSPRWSVNRFTTLQLHYTALSTTLQAYADEQNLLYVTLTVSR
jgi:hypothetical protein